MNQLSNRFLSVSLPALCFAVGLASMAACKDTVYVGGPAGDGGSTSADVGTGHSSRSGSGSGSGSDAGPVDSGAPAELCTRSGGTVVMTYCFANPPFAQYTCASGENGAICDPGPGETTPTTPECLCANGGASQCFDPAKGCVATGSGSGSDGGPGRGSDSSTGSDSGSDAGPTDAGASAALCTQTGGAVIQTYCSANPPFAEYTCTTGDNGDGICDPGPGETTPTTPECICGTLGSTSQCFDPVKGCVATGSDAGSDAGPSDAGATAALCTQSGGAVVMTYCSAKPPFEEYTCTTGDNGNGICDPGVREPRGLSRAG